VRALRLLPLLALVATGAAALAFDLTLPSRLPADADLAEAAASLRASGRGGDEVQVWPAWAERARLFVDSMPVRTEEDLRDADYVGVSRLWLLALPRVPNGHLDRAVDALRARAATEGEAARFGALTLTSWELHGPALLADLTGRNEEHEVDYVPRQCVAVPIPGRLSRRGPGGVLHVRAGIVGERAYQAFRGPVRVDVRAGDAAFGELIVPPTTPPEPGWRKLELNVPRGDHLYDLVVTARDRDRPFCVSAWVTAG
jgi:hypothetical protein